MAGKRAKPIRRRGYASGGEIDMPASPTFNQGGPTISSDSLGKGIMGGAMFAAKAYTMAKGLDTPKEKEPVRDDKTPIGYRRGGPIKHTSGPRIGKDDGLIPAQKGEYVIRKSAVNKLGTKALNQVNKGKLPARKTAR